MQINQTNQSENLLTQVDRVLAQCNSGRQIDSNRVRDMFSWLSIGLKSFVTSNQYIQVSTENIHPAVAKKSYVDDELNEAKQMIKAVQEQMKINNEKTALQIGISANDLKSKVDDKINKLQNEIYALGVRLMQAQNKLSRVQGGNFLVLQKPHVVNELVYPPFKPAFDAKSWVNPNSQWSNNLQFNENVITSKSFSYVFGKNKIIGQYTFTATFFKIGKYVQVGVADTLNYNIWNNSNYIVYQNDRDFIADGNLNKKEIGFKTGEKVTISVDLKEGTIQWRVGQEIRCQNIVPILKNNSITWVPYIYLPSKDDSVEISEE